MQLDLLSPEHHCLGTDRFGQNGTWRTLRYNPNHSAFSFSGRAACTVFTVRFHRYMQVAYRIRQENPQLSLIEANRMALKRAYSQ